MDSQTKSTKQHDVRSDTCIYCIGDSHVNLFSGLDYLQRKWPNPSINRLSQFRAIRVGPGLAYNLREYGTTMRARERLLEVIKTLPKNARILLCFGEIDCRYHLIRHAKKTKKDWEEVADECAQRYFEGLDILIKKGCRVSIYNVIPSSRHTKPDNKFPTVGTCLERNMMTKLFNEAVKRRCTNLGLPFVESFDALVDSRGITKSIYYLDKVHLAQRALPLTVRAIERALPDFNFEKPKYHSLKIFGSWLHLIFKERIRF